MKVKDGIMIGCLKTSTLVQVRTLTGLCGHAENHRL